MIEKVKILTKKKYRMTGNDKKRIMAQVTPFLPKGQSFSK
jgi:hypothetical protein